MKLYFLHLEHFFFYEYYFHIEKTVSHCNSSVASVTEGWIPRTNYNYGYVYPGEI